MNHQLVLSTALAAVLATGLATPTYASSSKEKCYGVAAAGQNDCANLSGTHSCAGVAKTDNDPAEWKLVAKGSCAKIGGLSESQARQKLGNSHNS